MREIERLGIEISETEIQTMADDFRRQHALTSASRMREFLAHEGLDLDTFAEMMREFAAIRIMERLYAEDIDRAVPDHIRLTAGAKQFGE